MTPRPMRRLLKRARRRLRVVWAAATAQAAAPLVAAAALTLVALGWAAPVAWAAPAAAMLPLLAAAAVLLVAVVFPIPDRLAARAADRGAGAGDVFATALELGGRDDMLASLVRSRAADAARAVDVRRAFPLRLQGRRLAATGVLVLCAAALAATAGPQEAARRRQEAEQAVLDREAAQLRADASALRADAVRSVDALQVEARRAAADRLEALAQELERSGSLRAGQEALGRARAELSASLSPGYLSEKAAAQGLERSLAAQPLA
ncbi:MAG: hypothetical protein ACKVWR_14755, partial [Acidimicrobiales bacterium]